MQLEQLMGLAANVGNMLSYISYGDMAGGACRWSS